MESYLAAIDLGTTSVEVSLLRPDGTVAAKHGFLNPWRKYGSDVISRITWQEKHPEQRQVPADEMKRAILPVLDRMLSWQEGRTLSSLRRICITGNAAMTAMFLGLDASCLGKAPFSLPFEELKELTISGIPCMVPASASAFLGSDSVGGAWSLPLGEDEILMDLGTNGEMLLCHSGEIYGASAACGPAFENCTRSQGIYGSTTISSIAGLISRRYTFGGYGQERDPFERDPYHCGYPASDPAGCGGFICYIFHARAKSRHGDKGIETDPSGGWIRIPYVHP